MRSARLFKSTLAYCLALVFAGFFMTSLSYLAWFYRLLDFASPQSADLLSMVGAYSCQALGVGLFALVRAQRPQLPCTRTVALALAAYALLSVPALLGASLAALLAAGYPLAVLCGFIAGYYLHQLAAHVPENRRALVFGGGYCLAGVAQWALGLVGAATLLRAPDALVTHMVLVLAFAYLVLWETPAAEPEAASEHEPANGGAPLPDNLLPLACTTVLFLSLVKNLGFSFPSSDIGAGVNLELLRLFYATGLVIAGIIADRNRQHGAACCLAACVVPFVMLALGNNTVSAAALWALDYFFNGFFVVFRVILFADIALRTKRMWLAGFGLMMGRAGEALGTALNAVLAPRPAALIALAALVFALTVFLFFRLAQCLYAPGPGTVPRRSERERFERFAAAYDLSTRERQVLRLILGEQSNAEIAAQMFISESTVKFHVHNLLGKTGSRKRVDLMAAYSTFEG